MSQDYKKSIIAQTLRRKNGDFWQRMHDKLFVNPARPMWMHYPLPMNGNSAQKVYSVSLCVTLQIQALPSPVQFEIDCLSTPDTVKDGIRYI